MPTLPAPWPADARRRVARRLARTARVCASIGLALCAGAFLACQRRGSGADGELGDAGRDAEGPAASGESAARADSFPASATSAEPSASAPASSAGASAASATAASAGSAPKKPTVDRTQHRKGMPVHDNLLE